MRRAAATSSRPRTTSGARTWCVCVLACVCLCLCLSVGLTCGPTSLLSLLRDQVASAYPSHKDKILGLSSLGTYGDQTVWTSRSSLRWTWTLENEGTVLTEFLCDPCVSAGFPQGRAPLHAGGEGGALPNCGVRRGLDGPGQPNLGNGGQGLGYLNPVHHFQFLHVWVDIENGQVAAHYDFFDSINPHVSACVWRPPCDNVWS